VSCNSRLVAVGGRSCLIQTPGDRKQAPEYCSNHSGGRMGTLHDVGPQR
jgi:hypothetical protein